MNFDKSLMSGSTMLLILHMLEIEDMYGYQMIKELEQRSDETFNLKEGTLYPILHALEKEGSVVSYKAKGDTGRQRKYYQITTEGEKRLASKKEEWSLFSQTVNRVIGGTNHG